MTRPAEFFDAIRARDHDRVRACLHADPALVHAFDSRAFDATPVTVAALHGGLPMVDLLLAHGADINRKSGWWAGGFAPIHAVDDPGVLRALVERGARVDAHAAAKLGRLDRLEALWRDNPDVIHERGGDGQFPLHFAATAEVVDWLLDRGAVLDARDVDHEGTAAQWAAHGRPAVARRLVERGAVGDPFMFAAIGAVDLLTSWLDAHPGDLQARITRERFDAPGSTAEHIYAYTLGMDHTLLHVAARGNQPGVARLLVARGLDVNVRGGYDESTPLHVAAWDGHAEAAEALLDLGAIIDAPSGPAHQNDPLGWAVVAGKPVLVALLLARGATVRAWHVNDARLGHEGKFDFSPGTPEQFTACLELLEATATPPGAPPPG